MSGFDPAFVPNLFSRTGITPTVGLGVPLYVIHATIVHPVTGAPTKLPPHHWVLFDQMGGTIVSASQQSDGKGVCVVNDIADPGQGALVLGLVPGPTDIRNAFLDADEAWIDLDKADWASPQPDRTKIDRRNLYRIPAWTTLRKSRRGGGFKEWPDKARPESRQMGVLSREDVLRKPFGSLGKPWEMPIDFGWVRATVRYFYFDWGRDKQNILPPGLFVDVVPSIPDSLVSRLGSGTAVKDGDGSVHLMIEAEPTHWPGFQFQFHAPPETRVDLAAAEPAASAKDTRLTADATCPPDPNARNRLPTVWHSLGQRCKATVKSSGKVLDRNGWVALSAQLHNEKAEEAIVEFHLDDVQLCKNDGTPRTGVNGRPALFDHFLTLLHPVASRPHLSDTTVDSSVLAADKVFTIGETLASGRKRLESSTRLVHIEGGLFDLRDERMQGTVGRTPGIGARRAVHNAHRIGNYAKGNPFFLNRGFYEIHLIDVPGVQDPIARQPLMHMLVFMSCKIDEGDFKPPALDAFYTIFTTASERWSQGSPGVPTSTKDYRIVARDPAQRNAVIRPRFYFGQVFGAGTVFGRALLTITLKHGDTRSGTAQPGWWLRGGDMDLYDSDIDRSVRGTGGSGKDSDGFTAAWHTLAHEFGHAMGLPDEYGEELLPKDVNSVSRWGNPRVLGYNSKAEGMPTDYRPFYGDRFAIMSQNALPRLRHYWHHVEALSRDAAFSGVAGSGFRIRHETLGLEYAKAIGEHEHPYTPLFFDKAIPGGRGQCALFPIGQDEGVAEAIFASPSPPSPPGAMAATLPATNRFNGLLIVRSRVRFRFDASVTAGEQWKTIWDKFFMRLYDDMHHEKIRFALVGGSKLSHIAIILQPLCAAGMGPFTSDDFKLVVSNRIPIPPNPFASASVSSSVDLDIAHFNSFSVLRAILGASTSTGSPPIANIMPLVAAEFANVAKLVDNEIGDPVGTRTIVPM